MEGLGLNDIDEAFLQNAADVLRRAEEYALQDGEELADIFADAVATGDALQMFERPYWPVDGCKKTDGCVSVALREHDDPPVRVSPPFL